MPLLPFETVERELIVKKAASTDERYGCKPVLRTVEELLDYGICIINKPEGPTSHQVSDYVQKILHISKSGHGGTLDPRVTGTLPVALGSGTRVVEALLTAGKEYVAIMHLHKDISEKAVKTVVKDFVGRITQMPPLKSAVARKARQREIYYIELLEIEGRDVLFKVGCQAGTYIRKLVHDIGLKLGGAHMAELLRTKAGPFKLEESITLQDLEDAYALWKQEGNEKFIRHCIKPVETAVAHLPKVFILDNAVATICHGALLNVPGIQSFESKFVKGDKIALMSLKGELVGIGSAVMNAEELEKAEKGLAVKPDKVMMKAEIYPRLAQK